MQMTSVAPVVAGSKGGSSLQECKNASLINRAPGPGYSHQQTPAPRERLLADPDGRLAWEAPCDTVASSGIVALSEDLRGRGMWPRPLSRRLTSYTYHQLLNVWSLSRDFFFFTQRQ